MKSISLRGALIVVAWTAGCGGGTPVAGPGGEEPGLDAAVLFAPGVVSTEANELNCALSPDGSMVVFSEWNDGQNTLMAVYRDGGGWGGRSALPFSGEASDVDPYFSADGARLYFSSKRPRGEDDELADSDLWSVERRGSGEWGEPSPVPGVNSPDMDEYYTSISIAGWIYFSIFPEHGSPGDIFRAAPTEHGFAEPESVAGGVNTEHNEHDPFIAPDESFLIFTSDRPGGFGRGDLWVVFAEADGGWSRAVNMGEEINTDAYEFCAMLSPDGAHLFFTRNSGGNGDIYQVDASVIDRLRGQVL